MAILWHTPSEKASDMTHYVTGTANDNKVLTPTQLEVDMPKRPNTLNTVMFVIELIRRIPKGRKITASELHQAMLDAGWDRDLRTIQRQLDEISRVFSQYIDRDDRAVVAKMVFRYGDDEIDPFAPAAPTGVSAAQSSAKTRNNDNAFFFIRIAP